MKNCLKKIIFIFFIIFSLNIFARDIIETIVMIRHGEIPPVEIGQLNCKGLNRSLLLPPFFKTNFPKPQFDTTNYRENLSGLIKKICPTTCVVM